MVKPDDRVLAINDTRLPLPTDVYEFKKQIVKARMRGAVRVTFQTPPPGGQPSASRIAGSAPGSTLSHTPPQR